MIESDREWTVFKPHLNILNNLRTIARGVTTPGGARTFRTSKSDWNFPRLRDRLDAMECLSKDRWFGLRRFQSFQKSFFVFNVVMLLILEVYLNVLRMSLFFLVKNDAWLRGNYAAAIKNSIQFEMHGQKTYVLL